MEKNDQSTKFENLRNNIKNIALVQSQEIFEKASPALNKRKFDIKKLGQELILLQLLNDVDASVIEREVKDLEISVQDLLDSSILVKDQATSELVPLPYEVLRLIIVSSNEKFRQHFYHDLMDYYYNKLCKNVKKLSPTKYISKEEFDQQVKISLPLVKLEIVLELVNTECAENRKLIEEISSNIKYFFKYPRLNQEDIYLVAYNRLNSKNYELLHYNLMPLDQNNGYLGDYFKLIITVKFEGTEEVFDLFAKFLTSKLEAFKDLLKLGPSMKEDFFYRIYLPELEKHGLHSLLDFAPNCYFSRLNDVLVLDDMVTLGYTAEKPNIKLNLDGLTIGIKQIAKLHACSFILEELLSEEAGKRVSLNEIYGKYLKDILYHCEAASLKENLNVTMKLIHYVVAKFPELTNKFTTEELTRKIDEGWNRNAELVSESKKFKNALCHGDMYIANMLFKFDQSKAYTDTMIVDYQILRYCPPVTDLLFFIVQNTFKETRDKHLPQLLDVYYTDLTKHLESFNMDIKKIYPREEFEEGVKYIKSFAIFTSLFYSQFNALEPDVRSNIVENPEMGKKYVSSDRRALIDLGFESESFKKVFRGLVEDLVELFESDVL